jgi:hypothetical protein
MMRPLHKKINNRMMWVDQFPHHAIIDLGDVWKN